jgi:hypothetical protein
MSSRDLLLRGGDTDDLSPGSNGIADVSGLESGVTRWGYEELSAVTETSRAAGLPVQAHFGQMWALPLEITTLGNAVDADESPRSIAEDVPPHLSAR